MTETIAALSSGLVPSGVAVVRVSGPRAREVCHSLCGRVPKPRVAALTKLKRPDGRLLDEALVLFFERPHSFTGEDTVEFHCHGSRAVVSGLLEEIAKQDGVRLSEAGDFSAQAFRNGKLDLVQVEGLADLLDATAPAQVDVALADYVGSGTLRVQEWSGQLLRVRAEIEAALDFSDEEDVPDVMFDSLAEQLRYFADQMELDLSGTMEERLREGFLVAIAGPPNAGKSTLLNFLVGRDAAIVSAEAGTTRDAIEVPVVLEGLPIRLVDTAGLRDEKKAGTVERLGMQLAERMMGDADCIIWLDPAGKDHHAGSVSEYVGYEKVYPDKLIRVRSKSDLLLAIEHEKAAVSGSDMKLAVSSRTGEGLHGLRSAITSLLLGESSGRPSGQTRVGTNPRRKAALREAVKHF
ncbi:MAG: tRNA uridine-5-carboxymethylaminomethyl(34) synthesis GTPase MnmE, partial [Myxococcota bacterium]